MLSFVLPIYLKTTALQPFKHSRPSLQLSLFLLSHRKEKKRERENSLTIYTHAHLSLSSGPERESKINSNSDFLAQTILFISHMQENKRWIEF